MGRSLRGATCPVASLLALEVHPSANTLYGIVVGSKFLGIKFALRAAPCALHKCSLFILFLQHEDLSIECVLEQTGYDCSC